MEHTGSPIPEEIRARLAHPTIRLSGPISHAMVASFLDQLLPVLEVEGSILVELFTDGGDAEIGRRLAAEVRLLRQQQGRDVWFLGKTQGLRMKIAEIFDGMEFGVVRGVSLKSGGPHVGEDFGGRILGLGRSSLWRQGRAPAD